MNSFFRHYGIRLWGTAFLGTMTGLLVLPVWQRLWGVHWLIVPVSVITAAIFIGLGWVMNRFGSFFLMRQLKEAMVYERAGLIVETKGAFEQTAALFDSFWLSPTKRKSENLRISSRMARFFLSQPLLNTYSRLVLAAHLKSFPHDDIVAESWLSCLLNVRDIFPEEYEAAMSVGETLQDHPKVQWGLFQFYLKDNRTDFNALKAYERVCRQKSSLPDAVLFKLAHLLLNNLMLNDWCLRIYLKAYESGESKCLEGIGAAARWLSETVDNASSLSFARKLIADLPKDQLASLTHRFEKHGKMTVSKSARSRKITVHHIIDADSIRIFFTALIFPCRRMMATFSSVVRGTYIFGRYSVKSWKYIMGGVLCLLVVWGGMLILPSKPVEPEKATTPEKTPPVAAPSKPVITDPFTIQVAAYLNPNDAKEYMRSLKAKGLDAFWTRATSASRVWYQVKVSHFPTKAQAQQYGDQLKSKGLIDDFYVANYQPTQ